MLDYELSALHLENLQLSGFYSLQQDSIFKSFVDFLLDLVYIQFEAQTIS
jgi:hypothetical protein